ncbi:MAG: tetratricopeptide repeat protein, partial [Planctomycetota bacterium]|nr:tetratricopeptide repeat protein [Planctomycetota bacterium]
MFRRVVSLVVLTFLAVAGCRSAASFLEAGNACYVRGDYEASIGHYRSARQKDPALPGIDDKIRLAEVRLTIQRGDTAVQRLQWDDAERAYREAGRLDPGNPEVSERLGRMTASRANHHFQRGQHLLTQGDPFQAIQEFEQTLAVQPNHPRAAEALRRAQAEGQDQKRRAETEFQEGRRAHGAGRFEEAIAHFQRALDMNPYHSAAQRELNRVRRQVAESLVRQGDEFARDGEWSRALDAYGRAREHDPRFPGMGGRIGRAEREVQVMALLADANRAYDRRHWRTAFERFHEAWKMSNDRDRFRERYESARGHLAVEIYEKGQAAEGRGGIEEALGLYRSILAFHPGYRDIRTRCDRLAVNLRTARESHEVASSALEARDLFRAEEEFQRCQQAIPGYRGASARLAEIRSALDRAQDFYQRAVRAESRGENERAHVFFEECLSISIPFRDAASRLSQLRSLAAPPPYDPTPHPDPHPDPHPHPRESAP